jgi:hypothetical protein
MFYSQYIMTYSVEYTEEFEDTTVVTRIRKISMIFELYFTYCDVI